MITRSKLIVAAGVAVAIGFFACLLRYSFSRPDNQSRHGQVYFNISPDGESIVFSAEDGDLYLFNLETRNVVQMTNSTANETAPAFCPDGDCIVYACEVDETNGSSIFVRSLDGKQVRQLTKDANVYDSNPACSSDGSEIVFARAHRSRPYSFGGITWDNWDLYVIKSDGSDLQRITEQKYYILQAPQFSRDGTTVVFSAEALTGHGSQPSTLFEVDVSGATPPQVPAMDQPQTGRYAVWASEPCLSPDGTRIAFISDRKAAFHYEIFVADRDVANRIPLGITRVRRYNQRPIFAPDGKSIWFLAGPELGAGNRPKLSLWKVDNDGANPRQIISSGLLRSGKTKAATNE